MNFPNIIQNDNDRHIHFDGYNINKIGDLIYITLIYF